MIIHNFKILCIMAINYSLVKLASKFGDKAGVPKFYARAQMNESISLKKFAKLIAMQTTVSYADVTAVLISLQENMVIELQRGNQIDFGELGKFRLQLTSEGAATAAEFKSDINIKGVNIQFIPGSDLANIFVGMEFEQVASRAVQKAALKAEKEGAKTLDIEEAKKKGAVAMFGEKYGETVRVVEMGDFSMEFCGGTHLDNTAKAGPFRIKSESSVASGVRRMEATCGRLSLESMEKSHSVLSKAAQFLKTAPAGLLERMEQQAGEMKQLRQAVDKFKAEASLGEAKQFLAAAKTVKGLHVLTATREGLDANALRKMGDFLRDKDPAVVGVLASISGEKITFLAVCGKEAVAKGVKAGDLVKMVSGICGGKGGGKPDSAMGGGNDPLKVDDALASVDDFVSEKLG